MRNVDSKVANAGVARAPQSFDGKSGPFRSGRRAAVLLLALCAAGCRVNKDDLQRWERTLGGPDKLVAVLTHDKYEPSLRVEAAWSLIEMKKRGGQQVGLNRLLDELVNLPEKDRDTILSGLWKRLAPKIAQPIEKTDDGKVDPTILYKDAAFAIFTAEKMDLDPKLRDDMTKAFVEWATGKESESPEKRLSTLEARLDNGAQSFSVEQLLRRLGIAATKRLPALLAAPAAIKSTKLDSLLRIAVDVKPSGSDKSGVVAYDKLRSELGNVVSKVITDTLGDGYVNAVRDETVKALKEAGGAAKETANDPEKLKKYLDKVREERLTTVFLAGKLVAAPAKAGGTPFAEITEQLLRIAGDEKERKEHRVLALAALDGNVNTATDADLKTLVAIAKSTKEDDVRNGALQRIGQYALESKAQQAMAAYYDLFDEPSWRVRYDSSVMLLGLLAKLSEKTAKGLPSSPKEFLEKLPAKDTTKYALGEPTSYGSLLAQLPKELGAKDAVDAALKDGKNFGALLTALGYYAMNGTPADVPTVEKFEKDKTPVAKCKEDEECGWDKPGCPVPKAGAKTDDDVEYKAVTTVGEFVTYCVFPAIAQRAKAVSGSK